MKVTFENDEEEFIFYAHRAIEAKEAGNEEEYLANQQMLSLRGDEASFCRQALVALPPLQKRFAVHASV